LDNQITPAVRVLTRDQLSEYQHYYVGENEQVTYVILCQTASEYAVHRCQFIVDDAAFLRIEIIHASHDMELYIECILQGKASHVVVRGVTIVNNQQQVTMHIVQEHIASDTTSSCIIKSSVSDSAFFMHTGMIRVKEQAHRSVSSLENKNIVIGNNARVVSVPNLEVLTNDVHCSHGSATGKYDEITLFYAATRGIDRACAQKLLQKAFFADMLITPQAHAVLQRLI